MNNKINAKTVAFTGMLGALSAVLMMFNFPVPFVPSFLKFDIAELPALFAGFILGPISGCFVIIVKIALKLVIQGTDTAFVGEAMNMVASLAFILPASIIYRFYHTKKGALVSLVVSTLFVSVVCVVVNAYISFPMYSKLYGLSMDKIIKMGAAVNPFVHDSFSLMLYGVLPFNIIKYAATSFITYIFYKKCANVLRSTLGIAIKRDGNR